MAHQLQRIGLTLAPSRQLDADRVLDLALAAESHGFDSIWIPETWGADAVSLLAILAEATGKIRIASGVFNVYSRSAMVLAQTAATLQSLSDGRFLMGLGASGPAVVENWHGHPYVRPVSRTREYIQAIRMALSGARVDVAGRDVHLQGFRLLNPPSAPVPVYVAALGPKNVRLAGEMADGWLPIFAARGHMEALFSELADGARTADRDPKRIDVAAYIPAAAGPRAELLLRQQLAYYVGGMGTFYADFLSRLGLESDVSHIRAAWAAGDRVSAVRDVPDSVLELCTISGADRAAGDRVRGYRQDGVTLPILALPHGTTFDEAALLIESLAPAPETGSAGV